VREHGLRDRQWQAYKGRIWNLRRIAARHKAVAKDDPAYLHLTVVEVSQAAIRAPLGKDGTLHSIDSSRGRRSRACALHLISLLSAPSRQRTGKSAGVAVTQSVASRNDIDYESLSQRAKDIWDRAALGRPSLGRPPLPINPSSQRVEGSSRRACGGVEESPLGNAKGSGSSET
jgi:hypothetical protein